MIRVINIKDEVLITIQIVADLSYAWDIIDRSVKNTYILISKNHKGSYSSGLNVIKKIVMSLHTQKYGPPL